jgi:hypothetical protein
VSPKQLQRVKEEGEVKKQQMRAEAQQQQQQQQPSLPGRGSGSGSGSAPLRETPQAVVDRMLKRILIFTGAPVATGIALLVFFYYLKASAWPGASNVPGSSAESVGESGTPHR